MKTAEQLYYDTFEGLNIEDNEDLIPEMMIDFAKMHVKAALKEALNNVRIDMNNGLDENGLPSPHFALIKDSILNGYPLENIK